MIIQLSPQVRDNNKIWYEIKDQKITATINDISDTFDFTDMPDGELQLYDPDGESMIETTLDEVPIFSAKKEDGVLTVELLFSIDLTEGDERLLFPEPMTLDEFNALMAELVERKELEEELGRGFEEELNRILEEEDSDDSLEEPDDFIESDEVDEDERVDGEELVHKDDYIIDLEEVDF